MVTSSFISHEFKSKDERQTEQSSWAEGKDYNMEYVTNLPNRTKKKKEGRSNLEEWSVLPRGEQLQRNREIFKDL